MVTSSEESHFSGTSCAWWVSASRAAGFLVNCVAGLDYEGGTTVGMLRIMSRRGDDRVTWDQQKLQVGDPEAMAAIREAERIFAQERAKGATAFRIDPGKPAQRIDTFDETAEQIVLVPRVVGG